MPFDGFHPAVVSWFTGRFKEPTPPQAEAWPAIKQGNHTLIAAPTGSGKTLASFLAAIDDLVHLSERGELADETHVLYISPLKALSNDIHKNLDEPLRGIEAELVIRGVPECRIRTWVRTGDTPAKDRQAMVKKPPHIVVTTPESLAILLTSERGRKMLETVRTVIVDEIHAVVQTKRGSHLALSLERLEALCGRRLTRIGLSATQKPIDEVARFLVGTSHADAEGRPDCTIIDSGHKRTMDLALEIPESPVESVISHEVWAELYDRLAALIEEHRTTLVFVNTRRMAERIARELTERLGADNICSHHGSLSREKRLDAEQKLKAGDLKALVATASLELGIDIGDMDLVCQIGSPRSVATLLQRIGRSGHAVGATPKGRLFPLSRDDLVECAALLDAVRRGELDGLIIPEYPLDIMAQHLVATVASEDWREDALFKLVRGAYPYRDLPRKDFDEVVKILSEGFATSRGRRGAYLHRDAVNGKVRARRGARLAAITSGGAIPDTADYRVVMQPTETFVGTVNEDFAIESAAGDIFQLGNTSWRILRVERGTVRVEDAANLPPTLPFWFGEAPGRTDLVSEAVSRLRSELDDFFVQPEGVASAMKWLAGDLGLSEAAARQITDYLAAGRAALGVMPTHDTVVLERFFDESGGMQLVLHSTFGTRVNRAWGLSLRKRFCRKFNFELQAAADENSIVLSLGPTHSFPLEEVFNYLHRESVRTVLIQAMLDSPMFATRWRWNAARFLAILRFAGGKKVAPQLQRMQAEDLLSLVFPDQLACAENLTGSREIPDHPLVKETIRDCLTEAMNIEALEGILERMSRNEIKLVARDLNEPSPLAQEILNASPYAFLDDAPLEERRTQAVMGRRWMSVDDASELADLDVDAVLRVRDEAWPDPRDPEELHDALLVMGFLTEDEGRRREPERLGIAENADREDADWAAWFASLCVGGRATVLRPRGSRLSLWVAAERLPLLTALFPDAELTPLIAAPEPKAWTRDDAVTQLVRSRLEGLGPVSVSNVAQTLDLKTGDVDAAMARLEGEGFAMRGRFTPGESDPEWCERRLLARVHRYTLNRLRQEIQPVTAAEFLRFLSRWQGVYAPERGEGPDALRRAVEQLEGFEAPASAWESDLLPGRVSDYDPTWLDQLCLSGQVGWLRRRRPASESTRGFGPVRTTPIALVPRDGLLQWGMRPAEGEAPALSGPAQELADALQSRGASFFGELVQNSELLRSQAETALGELVAGGLVHADSFTGLRALLVPFDKRRTDRRGRRPLFTIDGAGRWSILPARGGDDAAGWSEAETEGVAWTLLRRYGVVFRKMLDREGPLPPWRDLIRVYFRLEARGEIRGGRFVGGFSGQQFALPDAVGALRDVRRSDGAGEWVSVSGADPLNLVGILTPGDRIPSLPGNRILFRGGAPIAVKAGGETSWLTDLSQADRSEAKRAFPRRAYPERLRGYLGVTR